MFGEENWRDLGKNERFGKDNRRLEKENRWFGEKKGLGEESIIGKLGDATYRVRGMG